jgi:hypothetical protein
VCFLDCCDKAADLAAEGALLCEAENDEGLKIELVNRLGTFHYL